MSNPRFSKRHYEFLVDWLSKHGAEGISANQDPTTFLNILVLQLSLRLKQDNPRFDESRFCTIIDRRLYQELKRLPDGNRF